jgi:hypothetical protein
MSNPTIVISGDQPATISKMLWEDPCITLERDLEVLAQGGPPGEQPQWAPKGFLGPLSVSGGPGCTPT